MSKQGRSEKPNVVVFFTDQQRWDTTGVHGNPMGLTPNFDWMASNGTHIFNSFTCQPVCAPARSCLQTGSYATETSVFCNGMVLPSDKKTLAHYFKSAGYRTGYIGKWHLGESNVVPRSQQGGYDYWLGSNLLEFTSTPYDTELYDNSGSAVKLPGYRVDALADAAIRYISDNRDSSFFLFLSFLEPHHQNRYDSFPAPDVYRQIYNDPWIPPDLKALHGESCKNLSGYYGMVKRLDEALGRMIEALKSLGLLDDTIVLFTSDHGCHFKTRNSEYKRSCHESSIRVPTAVIGPGFNGGGRIAELVSLVDLPPSLLNAAGIPVPDTMRGQSILPLVKKQNCEWPEEVFVQISEAQLGRSVRTHRWKYSVSAPGKDPFAVSHSDEYYEEFLYDLVEDPHELSNLIDYDSHQLVRKIMRERLQKKMKQAGEAEASILEKRKGEILKHKEMPDPSQAQRVVTDEEAIS